jgi:hypothetical protein
MFMQDVKQKKWWYRCEACGAETEKRDDHASPSGLEGWHVDKYNDIDIHICPVCQASGKAPK